MKNETMSARNDSKNKLKRNLIDIKNNYKRLWLAKNNILILRQNNCILYSFFVIVKIPVNFFYLQGESSLKKWVMNLVWSSSYSTINNFRANYPRPPNNERSENYPSHPLYRCCGPYEQQSNHIRGRATPSHCPHPRIFYLFLAHSSLFP